MQRRRERTAYFERETFARSETQAIADARENDQGFELVIAVGAPAADFERQVDLGGRRFDECATRRMPLVAQPPLPGFFFAASVAEDVSSRSPDLSFSSIFLRSSGSGLRSRACDHWNCASSVRPTFQ